MAEEKQSYVLPALMQAVSRTGHVTDSTLRLFAVQEPRADQLLERVLQEHGRAELGGYFLVAHVGHARDVTTEELASAQRAVEHALTPARATEQATLPVGTQRGGYVWDGSQFVPGPDQPLSPQDEDDPPPVGLTAQQAAWVIRRLTRHLGEAEHEHLPLRGGQHVSVIATDLVEDWLQGFAVRVQHGEPL